MDVYVGATFGKLRICRNERGRPRLEYVCVHVYMHLFVCLCARARARVCVYGDKLDEGKRPLESCEFVEMSVSDLG